MKRELLLLTVGLILFGVLRSGSLPFAAEPEAVEPEVAEEIPAIDSTTPVIVPAQPEIQYDKTVLELFAYKHSSGNPILSYRVIPARVADGKLELLKKGNGATPLKRLDVIAERKRSAVFATALDGFRSALVLLAEEKALAKEEGVLAAIVESTLETEPTPEQIAELAAVRVKLAAVRLALGIEE